MIKYRLHWSVHPGKTEEWYEEECSRLTEDEIARELEIDYALSRSGKVFSAFRDNRHTVTKRPPINKSRPVYRIWDFGKTNAVIYGQIDEYNRKTLLHERVLGGESPSGITEQLRVALADSAELFDGCEFIDICDPAGSYEDERDARPEVQVLQDEGIYPEYQKIASLPTMERSKRGRTLISMDLQATPGGEEAFRLFVSQNDQEGCPVSRKAFLGGYCYKKDLNGNILDRVKSPNHPYEDVIDCIIYWYLEADSYDAGSKSNNLSIIYNKGYQNPYTGMRF